MRIKSLVLSAVLACAIPPSISRAVPLFEDNFDADTSANWTTNASGLNDAAVFNFDYSTIGIPAAPGAGGTTRGLKLQANTAGGVLSGVSVSPIGQSFTGDYTLEFDAWHNYNGPLNGGGNGSTQVTGAGIGTAGTTPQWAGAVYDSVFFGATGDGGSSIDYRVYPKANTASVASGMYAAGTSTSPDARNNDHPYYAGFGGNTAPAAQLELYPGQTGTTSVGSQGFEWHHVGITKLGNTVTYSIDDTLIATVDISAIQLGGSNILLNHFDINATSSTDPLASTLLFGLIDNVQVNAVVPEPGALTLLALSALALKRGRRPKHRGIAVRHDPASEGTI